MFLNRLLIYSLMLYFWAGVFENHWELSSLHLVSKVELWNKIFIIKLWLMVDCWVLINVQWQIFCAYWRWSKYILIVDKYIYSDIDIYWEFLIKITLKKVYCWNSCRAQINHLFSHITCVREAVWEFCFARPIKVLGLQTC